MKQTTTRRTFLRTTAAAAGSAMTACRENLTVVGEEQPFQGIVDIHQHAGYLERTDPQLLAHQELMGITQTVLLPSATAMAIPSTHDGKSNGLAAKARGNQACLDLAAAHPGSYATFANEIPDIETTRETLEKFLKAGAIGIGEQKFGVECDSKHIELVAAIAREFDVPVLLHFQHQRYNMGFERFHKILEKFPTVNFIGHAQTWWGNIDKNHEQATMYPNGPVTPGGLTDRYLSDYPNMFGDLSAGSGRNSLARDEDHAREFLARHQDKLMFGSDCPDAFGRGDHCIGASTLAILHRLVEDRSAREKILGRNARRLMRI